MRKGGLLDEDKAKSEIWEHGVGQVIGGLWGRFNWFTTVARNSRSLSIHFILLASIIYSPSLPNLYSFMLSHKFVLPAMLAVFHSSASSRCISTDGSYRSTGILHVRTTGIASANNSLFSFQEPVAFLRRGQASYTKQLKCRFRQILAAVSDDLDMSRTLKFTRLGKFWHVDIEIW